MGLIKFLKEKFAHRKEEKEEKTSPAVSNEENKTSSEEKPGPINEENKPLESQKDEINTSFDKTPDTTAKAITPKEDTAEVKEVSSQPVISEAKDKTTLNNEAEASEKNPEEPLSDKEKEKSIEDKYVAGLDKSRVGFTERLKKLANSHKVINQEYFDNLERILIEADVGVNLSLELIKETSIEASAKSITDPNELNDLLIDKMFVGYANRGGSFQTELNFAKEGPTVVLMCGVNGVGKTTTVAKLAKKYKDRGMKVLLVAADTFRAGAVEQLAFWAKKVGVDILTRPNSDPASLCYDALNKAKAEGYQLVLVDTAGRLQNKKGLMDELSKIVRVMKKIISEAPHESLLVIDANTGQNGIDQASVFRDSVPLTGIVITKMDGTSKGGIILSIRDQLALPVKFIGLGEKMDDLEEFDLDKYLYGLLIGE